MVDDVASTGMICVMDDVAGNGVICVLDEVDNGMYLTLPMRKRWGDLAMSSAPPPDQTRT